MSEQTGEKMNAETNSPDAHKRSGASEQLPIKTGKLKQIGRFRLGINKEYFFERCIDCGTDFPDGMCNGHQIGGLCPWCRPDSKPWKNGRGK